MSSELEKVVKEVNSIIENGVVILNDEVWDDVDSISTGLSSLDKAIGIGGIPVGRITEIYGNEATGKTTLALQTIAQAHKQGLNAAFIDMEHATTIQRMVELGVDLKKLIFSQPNSGEEALNIVEQLTSTGKISIIVVDSVAALVPMAEVEGDMGDAVIGVQARLMSQAMRKLNPMASKNNTAIVFINQTRSSIGFVGGQVTTGGVALRFYSSVRIKMVYMGKVMSGKNQVGRKIKAIVVKNKLAIPFKEVDLYLNERGLDDLPIVVTSLIKKGVLKQKGGWIYYQDKSLANGVIKLVQLLHNNPELYKTLTKEV